MVIANKSEIGFRKVYHKLEDDPVEQYFFNGKLILTVTNSVISPRKREIVSIGGFDFTVKEVRHDPEFNTTGYYLK